MESISVAMATYNGGRYLGEQLRSLAGQTRAPAELVVTDDGSSDDTLAILRAFAETAPFPVRVYSNTHRLGYAANFMRCAGLCTGALIAFCDQDDVWHRDKLAACAAAFGPGIQLVYHDAEVFEGDRTLRRLYGPGEGSSRPFGLSPWFVALGFTIVFRRGLLDFSGAWERTVGYGADPRLAHDVWISLLGNLCGPVVHLPEPLARYRMHGANATLKHADLLGDLRSNIGASRARAENGAAVLARVEALVRAEARRADLAVDAASLLAAADDLGRTAAWMGRRAALYRRPGALTAASLILDLLRSGAYGTRRTGGLGPKVLLKDLVVGCLLRPIFALEA